MGRIIAIASGKGGVGKSCVTAAAGAGLAALGRKTLMVDMDLGLRNLDTLFGMETQVLNHIGDYIRGNASLDEVITPVEAHPGLFLLAAAQYIDPFEITKEVLAELFGQLRERFDVVLADCPAGIGPIFETVIQNADEGIAVTEPVVSAVRDADKVLHCMEDAGIKYRFIIVNKLRYQLMTRSVMMSPDEIGEVLGVSLLGIVPMDENVIICSNSGKSLIGSGTPAGKAFERIASRMTGRAVPVPRLKRGRKGLFR